MGGLINRVADNWRPLFAIADLIGVDWPERVREAAVILAPRESESVGPMLLADIKAIFADKETDRLSSAEICNALAAMETRSWGEWKTSKSASPKPISQNQLARLLKDFHIGPDNIYPGDGSSKRPKGYRRAQFEEAWERYLAAEGATEPLNRYNADEMGTSHAFRTATSESEVADQKCEKPLRPNDCSGVAVQKGGNGLSGADAEPWPRVCEHCGTPERPSKRVQTYEFDGERFLLHPDCHGDWLAAPDPNEWSFNLNDGP